MAYPWKYPKDRETTRKIASWLLIRIPTDSTCSSPTPVLHRRPILLHESHKKYTICFLVLVLGLCFGLIWVIGSYSGCLKDPPIARPPVVYDWDGQSRTLNEEVTYYCVNDTHSAIGKVYICGKQRTWDLYINGSCECSRRLMLPRNPHLWVTLNATRRIGSVVDYYCLHRTNKTLLKYATAVCNASRKWEIVHNETSECQL